MTVPIEHFRRVLRERRRALLHQVDHITADLRRLDEELEPELEDSPAEFASETAGFAGGTGSHGLAPASRGTRSEGSKIAPGGAKST